MFSRCISFEVISIYPLMDFLFLLQDLNNLAAIVRGDLNKLVRGVLTALITIDVHGRDMVSEMVRNQVCMSQWKCYAQFCFTDLGPVITQTHLGCYPMLQLCIQVETKREKIPNFFHLLMMWHPESLVSSFIKVNLILVYKN
jgi:hypothetical protein